MSRRRGGGSHRWRGIMRIERFIEGLSKTKPCSLQPFGDDWRVAIKVSLIDLFSAFRSSVRIGLLRGRIPARLGLLDTIAGCRIQGYLQGFGRPVGWTAGKPSRSLRGRNFCIQRRGSRARQREPIGSGTQDPGLDDACIPDRMEAEPASPEDTYLIAAAIVGEADVERLMDVTEPVADEQYRRCLVLVGRIRAQNREILLDGGHHAGPTVRAGCRCYVSHVAREVCEMLPGPGPRVIGIRAGFGEAGEGS